MKCDARIRPFIGDATIECEAEGPHYDHSGTLRDFAFPGSVTTITWMEADRRNFHGEWPGPCPMAHCILPLDHRGNHAF